MSLVRLPGSMMVPIGAGWNERTNGLPAVASTVLDAANEAVIMLGHIVTSDGASHTINTTGSSAIGWQSGTVTFANAGTTCKVGIATVDTANGPPGRAVNVADVITFDVNASFAGGGGGITSAAWQASVPTAGTKTIANGDLVAICIQVTARAGVDTIRVSTGNAGSNQQLPALTTLLSAAYADSNLTPNSIITFADGAIGYIFASDVVSTISTRTWNSGGAVAEYGQLFQFPFAVEVSGLFGWVAPTANLDLVLYSDPLGTPAAQNTVSLDLNVMSSAAGRRFSVPLSSTYTVAANQPVVAAFKPGGSDVSAYYKTLNSATYRITDPWGTAGYGVQRASGAFADSNSSKDHYYIGLMVSGFGSHVAARALLGM